MTDEEIQKCYASMGKAYIERRDLLSRIQDIKRILSSIGDAAKVPSDNPFHADSEKIMQTAPDILREYSELKKSVIRVKELNKILDSK